MTTNIKSPKSVYAILEKDHKNTFQKLNRFYEVLKNLRYEGKPNLGKNLAEVRQLHAYFLKELKGHMRDEEKTLFPFLRVHIPRLEPMVYLLLSEHEDFRNCLQGLQKSIRQTKKGGASTAANIERICEQGTYLICLLRSHMWVESHSLYKAADKELRSNEKKKLIQQIQK